MSITNRIADAFAAADMRGWLHARDLDTGREVAVGADDQVVIGSIFKILLVLEFARQAAAGSLDPADRVLVRAGDRLGGWGTAGCADDVEMSLRDLAYFTMSVSDNTAADLLLQRVGPDLLPLLAQELGLTRTRLIGGPRELLATMIADVGARDDEEFARIFPDLPDEQVRALRVFDPARTNSSTPEEVTRLLGLIWRDAAGPAQACADVRALMFRQLFWTRLAAAFPPGVRVAGKTGTLPGLHMEAGVVEYPDGGRYAVAVFARTERLSMPRLELDLVLGRAAKLAVDDLRGE
ncbi:serine hydrolase [Catellatospora methionotrophica]|uniref:Serine hydrolase n=1 Tax=Catellatospora methionotrophica TaxID=121620 RepID=A0A8J3L9E5_9ACTN|nr:serine hydrolase [Catellatospora methionotrophica]GIG14827.1 serine hydrolase [Catellatospora methionotrophica]